MQPLNATDDKMLKVQT